jgi:hypothetical protein
MTTIFHTSAKFTEQELMIESLSLRPLLGLLGLLGLLVTIQKVLKA